MKGNWNPLILALDDGFQCLGNDIEKARNDTEKWGSDTEKGFKLWFSLAR
jgi:hypothetical protein